MAYAIVKGKKGYWRRAYRRKDGTLVKRTWVPASHKTWKMKIWRLK